MWHETIRRFHFGRPPTPDSHLIHRTSKHRTLRAKVKLLMKLFVSNYTASHSIMSSATWWIISKYVFKHSVDRLQFIKFRDSFSYSFEFVLMSRIRGGPSCINLGWYFSALWAAFVVSNCVLNICLAKLTSVG